MDDIRILEPSDLGALITELQGRGFRVMGPTRRGDAIVTAEIRSVSDLPQGVGDTQEPAEYRLHDRDDGAYFGFAAPAQSSKPVFFPAEEVVWRGERDHERCGVCAAATCARSRSTTGCCRAATTRTPTTRHDATAPW